MRPLTTLCYIKQGDKYLILHRTKKHGDINKDKWIGVGGKFEEGETPVECLLREVREETGLTLTSYTFRAIITFISDGWGCEYMHLFTATASGTPTPCDEGELVWLTMDELLQKNLWEGDKIFLRALENTPHFFTLKLHYHGDTLLESKFE